MMTRTELITRLCELAAGMEDARQGIHTAEQQLNTLSVDMQKLLRELQSEEPY